MRNFYIALVLLLLGPGPAAYAQWQWLNPKPNAYANKVVRFVDARQGVVLQTLGQVLRTDDAGATWQEARRFADASALDFSPQGVGYLLTKPGVLWRSTDAGRTWVRRSGAPQAAPSSFYYGTPPLTHTYSQVHAVSTDTVVEVTSDGWVRRSVDGGQSWRQADSKVNEVLSSSFPSGQVGYLGTGGGRIYKTTDGGLTWTKLSEVNYFPSEITMLHFVTPALGFAHREHSDLLRTQDGGATWALVASQLEDFSDLQFVSPTTGFAVGDYGTIYTTRDGGSTWTLIGPAATSGLINGNYWRSVWFTSPTTGYVVGQSNRGSLLRTTDGGLSWLPMPGLLGTIRALEFPGHGLVGYALSDSGLLKTTDGGDTWTKLPAGGTLLSCPDANTVVVGGGGGTVMRSGDGGATWKTTVIPARYGLGNNVVTLHMASSQVGYLATEDSAVGQMLARTTDGGQTWVLLPDPQLNGLRNFDFVTPTTGYATGYRNLYKTADSGQSWQELPVGDYWGLSDVDFVDEQVGYAIDEYGLLYQTQDGARTWQRSQLNRTQYGAGHAERVCFLDRTTGCVQTDNADVFRTTDGGRTWLWEFNLGSVALAYTHQGQSVVLGGSNGMLVRRSLRTNPLPFQARVLAPQLLTDSSAVLTGTLTALNCLVDSARFEFSPLSTPGFGYQAPAFPTLWYGGDSIRTAELKGLQSATTYRVRVRLRHNGAYYYSPDTVFTTPAAPVLPAPQPAAYPNPTTDYVRVVEPGRRASARIKVLTLSGTPVREATGAGVDLTGLPGGMYLLHIMLGERAYHYRVVKQ